MLHLIDARPQMLDDVGMQESAHSFTSKWGHKFGPHGRNGGGNIIR